MNIAAPAPGPPPPPVLHGSASWSGWVDSGGPFTAVSGTFIVPSVATSAQRRDVTEWVGIDGALPDVALIQAGVEQFYDPSTGLVDSSLWWDSFNSVPTFETPIPVPVAPGDQVTVAISEVTVGQWAIQVTNDTTNQSFMTDQAFDGSGASAEWIVEAPTVAGSISTLADYSPNVTFTNLAVTGTPTSAAPWTMIQNSVAVSTPSAMTPEGFTVAYGSVAPPPP